MISARKKVFIFWIIGCALFSSWDLNAQQYRTDILFMKHRESAKARMRLKLQRELQRQQTNPIDATLFVNSQNYNKARLQFGAANQFLDSREAAKERRKNWNPYLERKKEEKSRIQKGKPEQQSIDQIRRDYLEKERKHREFLRNGPTARQNDASNNKKSTRYAEYLAQKALHSKKTDMGNPEDIRRKRFSEKATAFNNFTQSRREIQRNSKTGISAQGQQKESPKKRTEYQTFTQSRREIQRNSKTGISAQGQQKESPKKRTEYQTFTQKHKKNRKDSNLAGLTQEKFLREKFSEKAQEFQNYVSTHKKNYVDVREKPPTP